MPSGIFLIGKNLSMEGFRDYVAPLFAEKGYAVNDRMAVYEKDSEDNAILIALIGDDPEASVETVLVEAGNKIDAEHGKKLVDESYTAYRYQVSEFSHWEGSPLEGTKVFHGLYKTIGIYSANGAASELFPSVAQGYLLDHLKTRAEEVANDITELFEPFAKK
ncbi:MAG: hypothetical protein HY517_04195 [Candidatus Aenigmarchaeota archaeon]|nr:hypothetical protein [Candidatus Aenigmarchaeota archaeon]